MDPRLHRLRDRVGELRVFTSPRTRRQFVVHLFVTILLFVVVAIFVQRHLGYLLDPVALRAVIRQYGALSPLVLVTLQALQVILAPVPGQVLAVVGGYLFGTWWGTLYNMIGITIGSSVAFWLSRRFGRAYVERIVHDEALAKFDAVDDDTASLTLFLMFLVPGLPDDVLCFAGGLTKIPLLKLVVIAIVGRLPAFFFANLVGDLAGMGRVSAAVTLSAVLVALSATGYLARDRLIRWFGGEP